MSTRSTPEREALNLRIKDADRALIDRAAKVRGQTRTAFVLDAARRAAEDALLEQRVLHASPAAYRKFVARLDADPRPNARLRKSLGAPPPWSEDDEPSRS